ncbi:MAG: hypothetical protein Q8K36_02215 [Alphaproteobacteria bacterium]|nr:hypothetical protein [Alphaproteobacteria bacterium]
MDTKQKEEIKFHIGNFTIQECFQKQNINSEEEKIHLDGIRAFYLQRKRWSYFIMGAIAIIIFFDMILTILVGRDILNFEKYNGFVITALGKTTLEIFGLAILVVKFLFHKR